MPVAAWDFPGRAPGTCRFKWPNWNQPGQLSSETQESWDQPTLLNKDGCGEMWPGASEGRHQAPPNPPSIGFSATPAPPSCSWIIKPTGEGVRWPEAVSGPSFPSRGGGIERPRATPPERWGLYRGPGRKGGDPAASGAAGSGARGVTWRRGWQRGTGTPAVRPAGPQGPGQVAGPGREQWGAEAAPWRSPTSGALRVLVEAARGVVLGAHTPAHGGPRRLVRHLRALVRARRRLCRLRRRRRRRAPDRRAAPLARRGPASAPLAAPPTALARPLPPRPLLPQSPGRPPGRPVPRAALASGSAPAGRGWPIPGEPQRPPHPFTDPHTRVQASPAPAPPDRQAPSAPTPRRHPPLPRPGLSRATPEQPGRAGPREAAHWLAAGEAAGGGVAERRRGKRRGPPSWRKGGDRAIPPRD